MAEDLDAIHLRACGCDEWHTDQADTEPVRSLMEHVVNPLLERDLCTCDGDPVECSHEVERPAADHELEALRESAVDGAR